MESERNGADKALTNTSLIERAYRIRRNALQMGAVQGQGYIAQALGIADVLAVAYFHAMRYRPDDPEWEGRDRFLLSIGHYAIALYAVLTEAGILPEDELETYGSDGSRLPMSGMAAYTPGMEITGGSLGQGLPVAIGFCLGLKRKKSDSRVYCLFADGELGEGSTWEAALSASHWKLDNLIGIVDVIAVHALNVPAERLEAGRRRLETCDLGRGTIRLLIVDVDNADQVVELEVARRPCAFPD